MPDQQAFHQYLRALAQSAVRTVIETVMIEELDALIGVGWGECSPKRKGYRNGSYSRDLVTSSGRIEEIKVPRDREGQLHTPSRTVGVELMGLLSSTLTLALLGGVGVLMSRRAAHARAIADK